MKKYYIIPVLVFLTLQYAYAAPKLCFDNFYGAELAVKVDDANEVRIPTAESLKFEPKCIGSLADISSLGIRTTGFGSSALSPFTSLNDKLEDLKKAATDRNNAGKEAVIVINASSVFSGWNIELQWRELGNFCAEVKAEFGEGHAGYKKGALHYHPDKCIIRLKMSKEECEELFKRMAKCYNK
jgi:hypothetical protein